MAKQEKIVVELVMDSIIKHSIELQRVGNSVGSELKKEFLVLTKDLEGIASDYDFSRTLPRAKRVKMRQAFIARGNAKIKESYKLLQATSVKRTLQIGNAETNFAAGSINKAVTGKGTIAFASSTISTNRVSVLANELIIKGAPQAKWWSRQSVSLQNKFSDLINDAWSNNQSIPEVAQRIRGTAAARYKDGLMTVSKSQADSLARTSIASVSNQVREETYLANSDVIRGVQFLAVLDNKTSPICRAYSGDKWLMEGGGWRNIEGGHDYRSPPLHFNCRSTMLPLLKEPRHLRTNFASKLALVPPKKQQSLGEFIGPKVCHSPCKYQDPDMWLRDQSVSYQKDVMGNLFDAWLAKKVSMKKVVTQKGRLISPDELLRKLNLKDELVEGIERLKTFDNLKASPTATPKYAKEVEKATKAQFLGIARKLSTDEAITNAKKDFFGRLLINVDPADIEYPQSFKPNNLKDMLGSQDKRLAFYLHTAKKFERSSAWRKGDLSKRRTSALSEIDRAVLDGLKKKITEDAAISNVNKEILLKLFSESRRIVGTQRALPMIESLLSLARKKSFSEIDSFLGYWNNAMGKAINTYFSKAVGLEVKLTASTEKAVRFNISSDIAKKAAYSLINRSDSLISKKVTLKEASEVKDKVSKIGKRKLRNFDGDVATAGNVNLELAAEDAIELYLGYLQDDVRMSTSEVRKWMERTKKSKYRTKDSKHATRVEFILKRTSPGDKVFVNDTILNSSLFKEWRDKVWTRRGFAEDIKAEVGQVLIDVEIRQGLNAYLKDKIKYPVGIDDAKFLNKVIDDYIGTSSVSKLRRSSALKVVDELHGLDGEARGVLRSKRAVAAEKRLAAEEKKAKKFAKQSAKEEAATEKYQVTKDTAAAKRARQKDKKVQSSQAEAQREAIEISWEELSDAEYIRDTADALSKSIFKNAYDAKSEFFREAGLTKGDDIIWLAKLVNKETMKALRKGSAEYTRIAGNLGRKYYYQTRGVLDASIEDVTRMGHFLLHEGIAKTGVVKRVKGTQLLQEGYSPARSIEVFQLETVSKKWEEAILANKTNYDIDGLPIVGKAPKIDLDGVYEDGTATIRTRNKDNQWSADTTKKERHKGWVKNLEYESETGININGYIYDVMSDLEKSGASIIPTKDFRAGLNGVKDRTKRESYDRARQIAKNVRDEKFFNKMTSDKYGRTYADTSAIQWQGDDINKGLMKFDRGIKLGKKGYMDFSRVFANTSGFDKIPMASRIKLLDKIPEKLILDTANDPMGNTWWYTKSDWIENKIFKDFKGIDKRDVADIKKLARGADPSGEGAFQLLALIEERARMIKHVNSGKKVDSFVSYLPMPADGTTNVLQHMGAISRNKTMTKAVNMSKTREVQDAYIALRDSLDDIGKNMSDANPLKIFIDLPAEVPHSIRRKSVKKGLMTAQYNAGAKIIGEGYFDELIAGFQKMVKAETDLIKKAEYEKRYNAFRTAKTSTHMAVGRRILEASEKKFPEAVKVRHTLNKFAEAHEISNKAIILETPVGFPFRQAYRRTTTEQIELNVGSGKKIKLTVQIDLDELDFQSQNTAFAPNYIHTMDAAHKSLTVNIMKEKYGIKDFSMIHDSFGVHAGHAELLQKALKEAFLTIYKDKNILRNLYREFQRKNINMSYFIKNAKGQKVAVVDLVKTQGEIPKHLTKYYSKTDKGWKYMGAKHYDERTGKNYPIEKIDIDEASRLGSYDFADLENSTYFFH